MGTKTSRWIAGRTAAMMVLLMGMPIVGAAEGLLIDPGVDIFTTVPGNGTSIGTSYDFSGTPLPPGFFGPGSDPFEGVINLQGLPLNTSAYGSTDTVVRRPDPGTPPTTIPIEIVALSLVSCEPITVTYGVDPSERWDVSVGLSPMPSTGTMQVQRIPSLNGGTFSSQFNVTPILTFTKIAPILDKVKGFIDSEQLSLPLGWWSYTAPGALSIPSYEGGMGTSNFFPGVDPGPLVTIFPLRYEGARFNWEMQLTPVPEPATLIGLLTAAVAGGLLWRRHRRKKRLCAGFN